MESTRLFTPSGVTKRVGQFVVGPASFADRDLIVPKSVSSTNFRAFGWGCLARAAARSVLRFART